MSLAKEIVRDRIAGEVQAHDLDLVVGLIGDKLAPDADMASIQAGIAAARTEFAVLFKPDETKKPAAESNLPVGFQPARDRSGDLIKLSTSSGNPWNSDAWNLTRQVALEHADPALAARMKAEAGR